MTPLKKHGSVFHMLRRPLTFIFSCVTFLLVFSSISNAYDTSNVTITGTLLKNLTTENWLGLKTSSGHIYKLKSEDKEVMATLQKLEDGDLISGTGLLDNATKFVALHSLTFIGLKRLLGFWWTSFGFAEIQTFSEMSFYQPLLREAQKSYSTKKSYQYSISPSANTSWVVFLSDDKTVYYTSMEFNGASASMKMYNPETGALMKTIDFTRISR